MNRHNSNRRKPRGKRRRNIVLVVVVLLSSAVLCVSATISGGMWLVRSVTEDDASDRDSTAQSWTVDSAELTVAVSPVMAPMLQELASQFNSLDNRTPDGQRMAVWIEPMVPEKMVQEALELPGFQAISPDSSLWLDQLEQSWSLRTEGQNASSQIPIGQMRISGQIRYAVSPVVIAAWEDVARKLGWPDKPIGWQDIQREATENPEFKWNHPSTNNASGLLATLAEFYAGAGLTRGLTESAATAQSTLDYVQNVEATVQFYGEGEEVIVQRLEQEGRDFLDAFVAQERIVIDWNRNSSTERLVAIYPAEGTLWTDHPLALLELGSQPHELAVTANQRLVYTAFADFLTRQDSQLQFLDAGYRPADLDIELGKPQSPFAGTDAVDWRQPQTTLQMPSPSVINVVRNVWYYTKRPTNVYLVVDTSGSMEGTKIARARDALTAFVSQIQGDRDRVGVIEFASEAKTFTPLRGLDDRNRQDLLDLIDGMEAYGGTALIDAVYAAATDLLAQADTSAINALVVMTDGQENESYYSLSEVESLLAGQTGSPIVVFTIAFGNDADEELLRKIADIGQGQFRRANEIDIEELYRIISTYF